MLGNILDGAMHCVWNETVEYYFHSAMIGFSHLISFTDGWQFYKVLISIPRNSNSIPQNVLPLAKYVSPEILSSYENVFQWYGLMWIVEYLSLWFNSHIWMFCNIDLVIVKLLCLSLHSNCMFYDKLIKPLNWTKM